MVWTCPKCKMENPQISTFCQRCGIKKEEIECLNKSQPSNQQLKSISKTSELIANAESSFDDQLKPIDFGDLAFYSTVTLVVGYGFYLLAIAILIGGWMMRLGLWYSTLLMIIPCLVGFSSHVISEMLKTLGYGKKCSYLSVKHGYMNTQLTKELMNQVERLEKQVQELSHSSQTE